jgi:hypothetical protein
MKRGVPIPPCNMAYKVFTSYAVPDRTKQMQKFMARFHEALRAKCGARSAQAIRELVFFDFKSIEAGDEWTAVMAKAVGEAETLVCLVSPSYMNSSWCGKELEVFDQRIAKLAGPPPKKPGARFVFPVLWEPDKRRTLPAKLAKFQFLKKTWPRNYTGGLRQLADLSKYRDTFKQFVEDLADTVDTALASKTSLPPLTFDFTTIASAFDDKPQPYDIFFWSAVAAGENWEPVAGGRNIAAEVSAAAGLMRVSVHPFAPESDLARQCETLGKNRQILLVIADAHTPPSAELKNLNASATPNALAFLLVDGQASPGQAPRAVSDWFAGLPDGAIHRAVKLKQATSCLAANAASEIEKITTRARLAIINEDAGAPAQNATLASEAESRGISTEAKASLTGSAPAR